MIESCYWKDDLLAYAKKFEPIVASDYLGEQKQYIFEKDVVLSFFIIRKLIEYHKFSSWVTNYKLEVFQSPCVKKVTQLNYHNIDKLYDFDKETVAKKMWILLAINSYIARLCVPIIIPIKIGKEFMFVLTMRVIISFIVLQLKK